MSVYKKLHDINGNNYQIKEYLPTYMNNKDSILDTTYVSNFYDQPDHHRNNINEFKNDNRYIKNFNMKINSLDRDVQQTVPVQHMGHHQKNVPVQHKHQVKNDILVEHNMQARHNIPVRHSIRENFKAPEKPITPTPTPQTEGYVTSPEIFGPAYWFTLHAGSVSYPIKASPITKEKMKHFILGIPVMLPCRNCQEHATAHIEKNFDKLDEIVSGRDSLFKFFVDFHNYVNVKNNKPEMSYEDAYKLYQGKVKITKMTYTSA